MTTREGLVSTVQNEISGLNYIIVTVKEIDKKYWLSVVAENKLAYLDIHYKVIRRNKKDAYESHNVLEKIVKSMPKEEWLIVAPEYMFPEDFALNIYDIVSVMAREFVENIFTDELLHRNMDSHDKKAISFDAKVYILFLCFSILRDVEHRKNPYYAKTVLKLKEIFEAELNEQSIVDDPFKIFYGSLSKYKESKKFDKSPQALIARLISIKYFQKDLQGLAYDSSLAVALSASKKIVEYI